MRRSGLSLLSRKINLYGLSAEEMCHTLTTLGDKTKHRPKQILDWVYSKGITEFDQMTNLPTTLRSTLKETFSFGSFEIVNEQISRDGTVKRALKLVDGQIIEAVLMPYDDGRRTACISSQAGCAMGCVFCATGQMGFSRQLSAVEIFEQAAMFSGELQRKNERLSNIVFMGMVSLLSSLLF
jgi:23S rRNA (adenine2503-C2)-methyltransferase